MRIFTSSRAALALVLASAAGCAVNADGRPFGAGGTSTTSSSTTGASSSGGAMPGPPLHASAIAVGAAHACALLDGGRVACWGDGARGQLGDGVSGAGHQRAMAAVIEDLSGVTALRAGGDTTCAITAGGGAICWGDGAFGQLGDGAAADGHVSALPVAVIDLAGVIDLAVGGDNACAVLAGGGVRCWGRNTPGGWLGFTSADCGPYPINTGDNGPKLMNVPCESKPREVPGAIDAAAIAAGGQHCCTRTTKDGARCWGADTFGQLGDGTSGPSAFAGAPVEVAALDGVVGLALGAAHSCAIAGVEGAVRCWGDNSFGQLGIGTDALDSFKITPAAVPDLVAVSAIHAAARTTCATRADGTVACWGETSTILPVSPTKGSALVPTDVPGVAGAVDARTGGGHVCARRGDGTVICWGSNDRGQLGTGAAGVADFSMMPVLAPPEPPG